jgi:hypothetical protein
MGVLEHAVRQEHRVGLAGELGIVVEQQVGGGSPHSAIRIEAFRACRATRAASGFAVTPATKSRRVPTWRKKSTYRSTNPFSVALRTEGKSHAQSVEACRATNSLQVPSPRFGPGSRPASRRMAATVVLLTVRMPSFLSSPNTRAYPHPVSRAIISTNWRMSSGVRGRPGLRVLAAGFGARSPATHRANVRR